MTNDKFKPFVPKTYEQFVLEGQQEQNQVENKNVADSYAAEVNAYGNLEVEKGYGPCRNTLCGCSCSSDKCTCVTASCQSEDAGAGFSASSRTKGANASVHMASAKGDDFEGRFMSLHVGGKVNDVTSKGISLNGELGVDFVNIKSNGVQANIGLNVDTGVKFSSDGVEAKFLGAGVEIGSNNFGIKTPFGGFSFE